MRVFVKGFVIDLDIVAGSNFDLVVEQGLSRSELACHKVYNLVYCVMVVQACYIVRIKRLSLDQGDLVSRSQD